MVAGRPKIYDLVIVAQELLDWAALDDSVNLNAFCAQKKIPPSYITRWAREDEQFCAAYEEAKAHLGERRERYLKEDKLHVKAYDLNARVYDHFLADNHKSEKRFDKELESELQKGISEDYENKLMQIANQLQRAREAFSKKKPSED